MKWSFMLRGAMAACLLFCVPALKAQTESDYTHGVDEAGTTATIWFAPTGSDTTWVDVHYTLTGGSQQNLRMSSNNGRYETAVAPVSVGQVLGYWFTYNKGSPAYDSASYSYTITGSSDGSGDDSGDGSSGDGSSWSGDTTFHIVNQTNGQWSDDQVYWSIIGKDWDSGAFVYVDATGNLVPMSTADNGALTKDGVGYTNYFHTLADVASVTIPPINSARIMFSVGAPMYIRVVVDGNGNIGYAGANIENPTDPNIDVYFDFGEMAILPPDNSNPGIFINTTRVDQFGFPLKMRVQGSGGYDESVGEPLTESRAALMSEFQSELPSEFSDLVEAPYRIVAPAHGSFSTGAAHAGYLQSYIDSVWNTFRSNTLNFSLEGMGTFSGYVSGNTFIFSGGNAGGTYYINGEPNTQEVLLGNGLLNDASGGSDSGVQLQIQAQMCAALNRHVAETPASWYDQSAHYPAGSAANWYASFWHDHDIDAKAYGFAYDDVGDFSPSLHTAAPTDVTFTIGW